MNEAAARQKSESSRLARSVPGLAMLGSYSREWFRPDVIAGVTVWAMLVPQALGYASLAGVPTQFGLYAAVGGLLLYWLWGSSRDLNVGPESTVAIMMAASLGPLATQGSDDYNNKAAMLAILVGLILVIGGIFKLGRIADFLSRPVLAGYVFGSGVLIVVSQLPDLLGIEVDLDLYLTDLGGIIQNLGDAQLTTLAVGAATVLIVVGFKRFAPTIPGALVALVVFIPLVAFTDLEVAVVGEFPSGVPIPGFPDVALEDIVSLIGPAIAISLLVYPDSVLTGRSLAVVGKYRLDADREFFGIGAANIGAGFFGGFPVNGSQSRSFVASDAGAKSQVSNLWAALLVLLTLAFLAPLFKTLPLAVLAGIVIVAGWGLLELTEFRELWKYRRVEFWMGVITIVAVLTIGMLPGILVAVALSVGAAVIRAASPHTAILGRVPDTDTYRDVDDYPGAETVPGLLIYRFDAPLFFANSSALRDEIVDALDTDPGLGEVVIDCESMFDVDSTGAQVILELLDSLDEREVGLSLARVRTEIRDELERSGIEERLEGEGVYLEVDDAVRAFRQRLTGR